MRVLVTGAGGFVGRGLLERLATAGYEGVGTGRTPPGPVPRGWIAASRNDLLYGGVSVGVVDAIVHLEVKHHVVINDDDTREALDRVNVEGTHEWLRWGADHGTTRFIFASSVKAVRAEARQTLETAAFEASDVYGSSKAKAEHAVRSWGTAQPHRTAIILRFAPIYGPGNTANLAVFARQVLRGRPCFVGQGQTRKSVVSLQNAVATIEWALRRSLLGCDVYNVSDRDTHSISEFATIIATAGGAPRPRGVPMLLARFGALAGDLAGWILQRSVLLNSRRLAATLEQTVFPSDKLVSHGFVHPQDTEQGIAELVAWLTEASQGSEIAASSRTPL